MRVFDLGCDQGHLFEGWFRSNTDYDSQRECGQLMCPICGSSRIDKRLSAPRINLGVGQDSERSAAVTVPQSPEPGQPQSSDPKALDPQALQALWLRMARMVVANTEDVGRAFVSEVRKIRDEEAPERPIRGLASPEETRALLDEGIEVMSLPLPLDLLGPLQ